MTYGLTEYLADMGSIITFILGKIGAVVNVITSNPPLLVAFGIIVLGAVINTLKKIF